MIQTAIDREQADCENSGLANQCLAPAESRTGSSRTGRLAAAPGTGHPSREFLGSVRIIASEADLDLDHMLVLLTERSI